MTGVSTLTRSPSVTSNRLGVSLRNSVLGCLFALAVSFGLFAESTFAQGPPDVSVPDPNAPVIQVEVEGNTTIPDAAILRQVRTQIGRPTSSKQILEDTRTLFESRWFIWVEPKVRYTERGVVVVFKVREKPIVRHIEYRGNRKIKTKTLEKLTGLRVGSPFDITANAECVRRIEEKYRDRGHAFAKVTLIEGNEVTDRSVIFQIDEGPNVRIRDIRFVGNDFLSAGMLKLRLKSKERLFWFFGGTYEPAAIPDDVASLTQYYHSLGFFDVKVDKEILFSQDRSAVDLEFRIVEGVRFRVRSLELVGNRVLSSQFLKQDLELEAGDYFDSRRMSLDLQKIREYYGERGRLFATIDAIPKFKARSGVVDLEYRIDEDRPYRIRSINGHIVGSNPRTKPTVMTDRVQLAPGDLANQVKIERGKQRIEGSGLFLRDPLNGPRVEITRVEDNWLQQDLNPTSLVRAQNPLDFESEWRAARPKADPLEPIVRAQNPGQAPPVVRGQNFNDLGLPQTQSTNPFYGTDPAGDPFANALTSEDPGWIDLDYYAAEARTGRLMFGAGYNSDAGVVGQVTVQETNFDILRFPRGFDDFGNAFRGGGQNFRLELVPGDLVSRYMVSWTDPFFLNTDYSLSVSGFYYSRFFEDWDEERAGGRIGIGRRLTDEITLRGTFRGETVDIENPTVPTPQELADVVGENTLTTFALELSHDSRDNAFLPSEGHFLQVGYEQAFGEFDFGKVTGEARQYFTTWERPDGTGRHVLSIGGETGYTSDDTPIFDQFYAGGYNTFRGFDFRGVSPRENNVATGGIFSLLGSVEYKIPVTANESFAVVAFTDFGTIDNEVSLDRFRMTAGFGFRLQVPAMGQMPLAFDFAFPIAREEFDDTRVFSFSVGITR